MKSFAFAAVAAGMVVFGAAAASATTYSGVRDVNGATVNLTITTDGTLGALSQGNITNWNISVTDGAGSVNMTPGDSQFLEIASDLSATATGLYYDFSNDGGLALWEITTIGDSGPFYCLNAGGSNCYGTSDPAEGASTQWGESPLESIDRAGRVLIAGAGVPEPATWAMMLLGLGGLGATMRIRRRETLAA